MTILDKLAEHARERVASAKQNISAEEIKKRAHAMPRGDFEFEKALKKKDIAFICECKKASPSKGIIAEDFPYLQIAKEYEAAGADCISVLTEPKWFLGSDRYLQEIAQAVNIPCLRKDFTVDEYMIYLRSLIPKDVIFVSESGVKAPEDVQLLREIGADAVLIGETLMKAADKTKKLNELRGI